jgi:small subunit ribosomal protein S9
MAKSTKDNYIEATGRRKTSTARVRISKSTSASFLVNDKPLEEYFASASQVSTVQGPLNVEDVKDKFQATAHVRGGGLSSQAEAIRHGLSRALVAHSDSLRTPLKKEGFLKRDPRSKERKKFGLKKARKASQWSKR